MSRFDFDYAPGEGHQITWEMTEYNLKRHLATEKGKAKLREFRDALLAMPDHRLITSNLATKEGEVCAIGAYAAYKRVQQGTDWPHAVELIRELYQPDSQWGWQIEIDAFETQDVGVRECGLTRTLAWLLAYQNDETYGYDSPEDRWQKTLAWVSRQLGEPVRA